MDNSAIKSQTGQGKPKMPAAWPLLMQRAIETSDCGFALADMAGRLTYVNASMLRLWGYVEPAEVIGRLAEDFWSEPEEARAVIAEIISGSVKSHEMQAVKKDGTCFTVQLVASSVPDTEGSPMAMMASFTDVTEQRRAEAEARRLGHSASIAEVVTGLAHDLNNALTSVYNNIYLARTYAPTDLRRTLEKLDSALGTLAETGESMRQIMALRKPEQQTECVCAMGISPIGARALLMDDEWLLCKTASEMLGEMGVELDVAQEGAEAVAKYREALSGPAPYDAVVLDLTVYTGMGGAEAAGLIRAMDPGAFIVATTGMAFDPQGLQEAFRGFDDFLIKPYEPSEFCAKVSIGVRKSRDRKKELR